MKRKLRASSSVKSSSQSSINLRRLNLPISIITFFLGVIATFAITQVFAQTSDTNQIYACVNNTNGNVRIVTANDACKQAERSVRWSMQGPTGPAGEPGLASSTGLPFFCNSCYLTPFADKFAGKDFSRSQLLFSTFADADISGVNLKGAYFRSMTFRNANLTGADLSELRNSMGLTTVSDLIMNGANLSNANLSNNILQDSDFRTANLQNTNFSNTKFIRVKFTGAQNMSTTNLTGATFEETTCPDGTNSDAHGATCSGHM